MQPLVSVIIPTYNEEDYIQECIHSLQQQTLQEFEVIFIDDDSTDATREHIRNADDDRFRLIHRTESQSIPSARNRGIAESRGKFIANQDADDISRPQRLERQVEYLNAHEHVDIVGTQCQNFTTTRRLDKPRSLAHEPAQYMPNQFVHGSLMFRQEVLSTLGGYDESFHVAEDAELMAQAESNYTFHNMQERLYKRRVYTGSTYEQDPTRATRYGKYVRGEYDMPVSRFAQLTEDEVSDVMTEDKYAEYTSELAVEHLRFGNFQKARSYGYRSLPSIKAVALIFLSLTTIHVVDAFEYIERQKNNYFE